VMKITALFLFRACRGDHREVEALANVPDACQDSALAISQVGALDEDSERREKTAVVTNETGRKATTRRPSSRGLT
jgi:hypothetical protein